MAQRAKQLKEIIMAKKINNNTKPTPSVAPLPPVMNEASPETLQAAELLDSVAKDIEMQDQEGSEEGEIDEHAETLHTLPPRPPAHANHEPSSQRKRKHGQGSHPRSFTGDKPDRKARKKAKKAAKGVS